MILSAKDNPNMSRAQRQRVIAFRKKAAVLAAKFAPRQPIVKHKQPRTMDDRLRELWALIGEVPPWERGRA